MEASWGRTLFCPIMVGRSSDLARLDALLARAWYGTGQVVLLSGEAGIGKSRLVSEVRRLAVARDFDLLQSTCLPLDRSGCYSPLFELLSVLTSSYDTIAEDLRPFLADLFPLLPCAMQFLIMQNLSFSFICCNPEQEKIRLFSALTHFLQRKADHTPLFLCVEDLHWSDELGLQFLYYFARQCTAHPLFLLLTYRDDVLSPVLQHWISLLERERLPCEISLTRLSSAQLDEMLQAMLTLLPAVRADLLRLVADLAQGNPFLVEELLQSLLTTGSLFLSACGTWELKPLPILRVPRSVLDFVQLQSAGLSMCARQILPLLAVIGPRFDFTLLQRLTDLDETCLVSLLKELIAAQLLVEETEERFAFRRPLARLVIYVGLLERERRQLQARVAETVKCLAGSSLEAYQADVHWHFAEAGMGETSLIVAQQVAEPALSAPLVRSRSSRRQEKLAYHGLTAREREVAALLAQGKYNREIAADLTVSERTVESHVANIMEKLGFTSRRQIASWARDKGLFQSSEGEKVSLRADDVER